MNSKRERTLSALIYVLNIYMHSITLFIFHSQWQLCVIYWLTETRSRGALHHIYMYLLKHKMMNLIFSLMEFSFEHITISRSRSRGLHLLLRSHAVRKAQERCAHLCASAANIINEWHTVRARLGCFKVRASSLSSTRTTR